jgi:hypothetical protein
MLTKMVSHTEDLLKAHDKKQVSDPVAFAALIVSMEIGTLVMSSVRSSKVAARPANYGCPWRGQPASRQPFR